MVSSHIFMLTKRTEVKCLGNDTKHQSNSLACVNLRVKLQRKPQHGRVCLFVCFGNRARRHAKTNLGDIKGPSQYNFFGIAQVTFGTSTGHFWHVDGSLLACRRAVSILLFTFFQPAARPILL